MIGNRIADLDDPETEADILHPGFDQRVFASAEAHPFGRFVAAVWTQSAAGEAS
jgi:hypothetical protein